MLVKREDTYKDDDANVTRREQQIDPRLDLGDLDVEARRDDTGFVEAAVKLHDDLAGTMVIDLLELANVT